MRGSTGSTSSAFKKKKKCKLPVGTEEKAAGAREREIQKRRCGPRPLLIRGGAGIEKGALSLWIKKRAHRRGIYSEERMLLERPHRLLIYLKEEVRARPD